MNLTQIDVSDLAPPEPMAAILSALSLLQVLSVNDDLQCLVVKHRRQPFPLYEKLSSAGWAYHCEVNTEDDILLYIFRQTSQQAFDQYIKLHIADRFKVENGRYE